MQIQQEPVQFFSSNFELRGQAQKGELTLISPLGSVLAVLRWDEQAAWLDTGRGQPQRFDSVEQLTLSVTGAALPLNVLFAWLSGEPAALPGWSVDLSQQAQGRLSATKDQPAPALALRVVLDR